MLRTALVRATKNVTTALRKAHISEVLQSVMHASRKHEDKHGGGVLDAFRTYIKITRDFGPTERKIFEIMELGFLDESDFWTQAVAGSEGPEMSLGSCRQAVYVATEYLPKFVDLMARDSDLIATRTETGQEPGDTDPSRLSITIIEEHRQSSPERLVRALESINGLYRACAQLMDESEQSDLCVIACDSGSDKSFDFLGAAKIIECVKEVLLSFWDRVVYFREDKTARRLELITQSLPIMERLAAMKESGKLEPERAELIKRQVLESITKFAAAGITIPEIEDRTVHNPRQLMKPEPKLLVEPKQPMIDEDTGERRSEKIGSDIADPQFVAYMEKAAKEFREQQGASNDAALPEQAEEPDDESNNAKDSGVG